ncbi:MAG: SDR family oxidoreductase [Lachnospiraceae bacterium]|nr:SDR family oxidoreductase [Lachnospiraceae bacterium]
MYAIDNSGKNAIVTGGGRGLGLEIVHRLALSGARVIIADILPDDEVAKNLDAFTDIPDNRPVFMHCDISDENECNKLIEETVNRFGSVDILVNNAAVSYLDWIKCFEVNLLAQFYLNEAAIKDMSKRGYGKIVNITTSGTFSGGGAGVKYNATKGAADSLTRFMAKQYASEGIHINAVAPGPVLTELMKDYYGEDVFTEHYLGQMPLKKLIMPENVADTVLFLCSAMSDGVTGETILADGGRVRLCP